MTRIKKEVVFTTERFSLLLPVVGFLSMTGSRSLMEATALGQQVLLAVRSVCFAKMFYGEKSGFKSC